MFYLESTLETHFDTVIFPYKNGNISKFKSISYTSYNLEINLSSEWWVLLLLSMIWSQIALGGSGNLLEMYFLGPL